MKVKKKEITAFAIISFFDLIKWRDFFSYNN